ncbi:glycosyltransferase family 2 protein [bacterium]|nr:glycosyltransferase family 2 protein [candidate division CSSED10-310 bacterium]
MIVPLNETRIRPDLAICIVNWNTRELLRECLRSIKDTLGELKAEVFVVDNCSRDGSADMVADEFSRVCLIRNEQNRGFGMANNQAISLARAPFILILNPDIVALPGAIENMVKFLVQHPEAGAIGGKMLNADRTLQYSLRTFPSALTAFTENHDLNWLPCMSALYNRYRMFTWHHESLREVDQPMGAAMMVRRSVIETLGGFDENFHMFFEDVDLCYRIKRNGWKIYYVPAARIVHYGGCSVRQRDKIGEEFYASLMKFYLKNHGWRYTMFIRVCMVVMGLGCIAVAAPFAALRKRSWLDTVKAALQVIRYGCYYRIPREINRHYLP